MSIMSTLKILVVGTNHKETFQFMCTIKKIPQKNTGGGNKHKSNIPNHSYDFTNMHVGHGHCQTC